MPTKVPIRPEINPATGETRSRDSENYRDAKAAGANILRDIAKGRRDYIREAVTELVQIRVGPPVPFGFLVLEGLSIKPTSTAKNEKAAKVEKVRREVEPHRAPEPDDGGRLRRDMAKPLPDKSMCSVQLALPETAASLGVRVIVVNPANTSQRSSECGDLPAVKKTFAVRTHVCGACGFSIDRDATAARNILAFGHEALLQEEAHRSAKQAYPLNVETDLTRMQAREPAGGLVRLATPVEPAKPDDMDGIHDTP